MSSKQSKNKTRPTPSQYRSHLRVQKILENAKKLLILEGYDQLNIQKIARKAGVTAPSIYRYFPNKRSIIATFAEVFLESQTQAIYFCLEKSLSGVSWEDVLSLFMNLLQEGMHTEKWIYPAQLAIRSDFGLVEVHEQLIDDIAKRFVLLLRSFGIKNTDEEAFVLSRMVILLLDSFMLALGRAPVEEHDDILERFHQVIVSYLRNDISK